MCEITIVEFFFLSFRFFYLMIIFYCSAFIDIFIYLYYIIMYTIRIFCMFNSMCRYFDIINLIQFNIYIYIFIENDLSYLSYLPKYTRCIF